MNPSADPDAPRAVLTPGLDVELARTPHLLALPDQHGTRHPGQTVLGEVGAQGPGRRTGRGSSPIPNPSSNIRATAPPSSRRTGRAPRPPDPGRPRRSPCSFGLRAGAFPRHGWARSSAADRSTPAAPAVRVEILDARGRSPWRSARGPRTAAERGRQLGHPRGTRRDVDLDGDLAGGDDLGRRATSPAPRSPSRTPSRASDARRTGVPSRA